MAQNYEILRRNERPGFQEPNQTDTLNKYMESSSTESVKKGHFSLAKFGTLAYLIDYWTLIDLK